MLIEEEWLDRVIIFVNIKYCCEEIWGYLVVDGYCVGLLIGDVVQKKCLCIFDEFICGDLDILVVIDVVVCGLYILVVMYVFNYDLFDDCEDYVYCIGCIGCVGVSGYFISLVCEEYVLNLFVIEIYIGYLILVSKYNSDVLMIDLLKLLCFMCLCIGNGLCCIGVLCNCCCLG